MSKARLATEIGAMLLEPTLNKAGEGLRDWFAEKDIIARGADLFGNIGETTRAKVLGGLVDRESFAAPAVDIAKYKQENFKPRGSHAYPDMSKKARERQEYKDAIGGVIPDVYYATDRKLGTDYVDSTFEDAGGDIATPGGMNEEVIAGRTFNVNPSQAGAFEAGPVETLIPNTFAKSVGIDNLERAKYASEIAGWGASSAALGAAALGMNALMRGGRKPRSEYSLAVQDSGGYNPNVEASRASYEYSAKLEELKQRHRRENEWNRQQARVPGVQQYSAPPSGGYGQYPDMNFNAAQMAQSIINAPTPVYG